MKGKNTLRDNPFRYGGILKDYSKEIHKLNGHEYKCWCCGRDMKSHALEEKTKEKTVKRKKNYYLVKSDVLGYAKRKGLINGRSKRQISERGT